MHHLNPQSTLTSSKPVLQFGVNNSSPLCPSAGINANNSRRQYDENQENAHLENKIVPRAEGLKKPSEGGVYGGGPPCGPSSAPPLRASLVQPNQYLNPNARPHAQQQHNHLQPSNHQTLQVPQSSSHLRRPAYPPRAPGYLTPLQPTATHGREEGEADTRQPTSSVGGSSMSMSSPSGDTGMGQRGRVDLMSSPLLHPPRQPGPRPPTRGPLPAALLREPATSASMGEGGDTNGRCMTQLLRSDFLVDDGKTPRSIEISRPENRIMRIPDTHMMMKQQMGLHDMLQGIFKDPNGFAEYIALQRVETEKRVHERVRCMASPLDVSVHGAHKASNYRVIRPVGKGRFSTVFLGCRVSDRLPCAVKQVKLSGPAQNGDKSFAIKCHKEVGLLRNLCHPNIVRYLDSFLQHDTLVIVLEWAGGGDLKAYLQKHRCAPGGPRPMQELTIWSFFSQCAEAVRHMHKQRIMHRDIKPSNVFVMADGRIKLGDLGLGRYLDCQSVMAFSQVGTPLYMSPEVLRGEGHDFASDMWSLGCLLYEMATLQSPFEEKGMTMDRLFAKIINGTYPPLPQNRYRPFLAALVAHLIQVDPKQRPPIEKVSAAAKLAYQQCRKEEGLDEPQESEEGEEGEADEEESRAPPTSPQEGQSDDEDNSTASTDQMDYDEDEDSQMGGYSEEDEEEDEDEDEEGEVQDLGDSILQMDVSREVAHAPSPPRVPSHCPTSLPQRAPLQPIPTSSSGGTSNNNCPSPPPSSHPRHRMHSSKSMPTLLPLNPVPSFARTFPPPTEGKPSNGSGPSSPLRPRPLTLLRSSSSPSTRSTSPMLHALPPRQLSSSSSLSTPSIDKTTSSSGGSGNGSMCPTPIDCPTSLPPTVRSRRRHSLSGPPLSRYADKCREALALEEEEQETGREMTLVEAREEHRRRGGKPRHRGREEEARGREEGREGGLWGGRQQARAWQASEESSMCMAQQENRVERSSSGDGRLQHCQSGPEGMGRQGSAYTPTVVFEESCMSMSTDMMRVSASNL